MFPRVHVFGRQYLHIFINIAPIQFCRIHILLADLAINLEIIPHITIIDLLTLLLTASKRAILSCFVASFHISLKEVYRPNSILLITKLP